MQHFTLKGLKTHTITFRNLQTKMSDRFMFGESGRFIVLNLEQTSNEELRMRRASVISWVSYPLISAYSCL